VSYAAKNYAKRLAATALFRNRQRLLALLGHLQDLVLTFNPRQICCEASPAIETILQCPPAAVTGKSLAALVHPDDLPGLRQEIAVAMGNPDRPNANVCRIFGRLRVDETAPWRSFNITVAAVALDGRVTELLLICHDITEKQRNEAILTTLKQTEARYRNIFENASEGIYQIAPDGRYISVNPRLAMMLGYGTPEALMMDEPQSCKAAQYCDPGRWLDFICAMESAMVVTNFESLVRRRDGSTLWVTENARSVCDRFGSLLYYEGTLSDITYRKRSEEALHRANETLERRVQERTAALTAANQKLRIEIQERERAQAALTLGNQAMNACSNGIIISDARLPDAPFVYVNPAFERMTGYGADEAIGKTYGLLVGPGTDGEAIARLRLAIAKREECRLVLRTYRRDGSMFWSELSLSPIRSEQGQVTHLVGIQNDMTQRRQLEEDLQKALAAERELNDMKSRFISTTSHEFRTPLTSILSSSEFLQHYGLTLPMEKRDRHFQRIQRAVKNMTQLLDDVLHISRAEAGKIALNPEPLDLREFCLELVDELQGSFPDHGIVFEEMGAADGGVGADSAIAIAGAGCPLTGGLPCLDPKLLRHILTNLLSNAVKYSPQSPTVWLRLGMGPDQVVFEVCDRGIGIPPADLERLFESFHRAANVGAISGTGLGLAIVQNAVQLHGGAIAVASEEGQGSVFTVRLPVRPPVSADGAAGAEGERKGGEKSHKLESPQKPEKSDKTEKSEKPDAPPSPSTSVAAIANWDRSTVRSQPAPP
jgi:PAS domain S-box-containing protein